MINHKKLLGKNVVSIFDGCECGKVENFFIKDFKLLFFEIVSNQKKFLLPSKSFFCVGKKIVLAKNLSDAFVGTPAKHQNFLGKKVVDTSGKSFGKVQSLWFSKNFFLKKISTNNFSFSPKKILCLGNVVVLKTNKNQNLQSFAPKNTQKLEKSTQKVSVLEKHTKIVVKNT